MGLLSESSLAPGFRFHPTDEELVCYYLKRKASAKVFRFEPISVVDVYKFEPWDLPDKSQLKTRDLEWYFFSALDRKYGNSLRTNRATEKGYWKTTGKDREVRHNSRTTGMKKTLVYHSGRAPRGNRTNWVMHEYRLVDEEFEKRGIFEDLFVLCRVFQKSGPGPKNGEKYGAPFVDEEWEDDEELILVPGQETMTNEELTGEVGDFKQNDEGGGVSSENGLLLSSFYHGETNTSIDQSNSYVEDDQKLIIDDMGESSKLWDDLISKMQTEDFELNNEKPMGSNSIGESNEPYLNAPNDLSLSDGLFLETDDLSNRINADSTAFDLLDDYLTFFDADGDNSFISFDPSEIIRSEELVSDQAENVNGEIDHTSMVESKHLSVSSSSKQKLEISQTKTGPKLSFILGSMPAPPAFASEIPSKEAALRLRSMVRPSSPVDVKSSRMWSILEKNVVSSGDIISSALLFPLAGVLFLRPESLVSPCFFLFLLFWVLLLSLGFKVGCACICDTAGRE